MLFKSKKLRKDEAKTKRKNEFIEFLRSAEGRRIIFELAPDILVSSKLTTILNDVRVQLETLSANEAERFTILLETASKTAEHRFSDEINQLNQDLAKKLTEVRNCLTDFLLSQEGRRLKFDLLVEALAKGGLRPVLDGAEARLESLAKEMADGHMACAEISLERSAEARAAVFKRSANEAARDLANHIERDVMQQLSSYRDAIVEVVEEQLPVTLREEVAKHVRSGPLFFPPCSNRALAAAHGISIREVKRRRRCGYFD
jgi:hypothetical protein